ncbi:amidase [Prosthecobacter dejongeii]|uniref:Amidase n=1 Tax=Prosthecobacter dejongeii TaxID=48465 RepID=A0A7W7YJI9_9BACT|nr:amidase [Prosthecobacter dejongeii]MBB5037396.1 amidase [Prosthecobacter dejongeii]
MKRRLFIGSALTVLAGCRREEDILPTEGVTVAELATRLHQGRVGAERVLDYYLGRIAALDRAGPELHAIVEMNPDVRRPGGAGPLRGIPILIKDNIETADAMETTAGSLALLGAPKPAQDATVVKRLREAGAVILGKTNLSEWANIRSPSSTSGWSARGGLTLNPHNLEHSASGSSSGSAVAVAAGLCAAAVGTETNGSIVSPAAACGIVGFKPTMGLISRAGIIPITRWQDTAGPMTQTVRDAALLLNVLAGADARDAATAQAQVAKDYSFTLGPDGLKGRRLGILRSLSGFNRQVWRLFERSLLTLQEAGAILVEDVEIPNHREASSAAWIAMLTEFRQELNAYLIARGGVVKSLAELIAYNEEHRTQEMPYFNQEFFIEAESRNTPEHLAKAMELRQLATRLAGPEGIDRALKKDRLDALICPTNDPAGRIDLGLGDANVRVFSTQAAVAGYPHLTVPMGLAEGLPVGLSFIGPAWSEARLLELGHAYEVSREFVPSRLFV